jgi:hypothetical protein
MCNSRCCPTRPYFQPYQVVLRLRFREHASRNEIAFLIGNKISLQNGKFRSIGLPCKHPAMYRAL